MRQNVLFTTLIFGALLLLSSKLLAQSNVGFGTPNPNSKLEVKGYGVDSTTSSLHVKNGSGQSLFFVRDDGKVSVSDTLPHRSAAMDIKSTTGGFLMPRLTTTERDNITGPPTGLIIYNTTDDCINFWNGSTWRSVCGL